MSPPSSKRNRRRDGSEAERETSRPRTSPLQRPTAASDDRIGTRPESPELPLPLRQRTQGRPSKNDRLSRSARRLFSAPRPPSARQSLENRRHHQRQAKKASDRMVLSPVKMISTKCGRGERQTAISVGGYCIPVCSSHKAQLIVPIAVAWCIPASGLSGRMNNGAVVRNRVLRCHEGSPAKVSAFAHGLREPAK